MLAYAVHESGYREVIGLDVGEAETEAFWRSFLRGLVERGLTGVQLVVSDAHAGLKKAIAQVLGCPWQRCSVHFLREALGYARREQQPMLAALIRPIFNADSGGRHESCSARHSNGSGRRSRRSPTCSKKPRTTCSRSTPSRPTTGPSCARPTRSSTRQEGGQAPSGSIQLTHSCHRRRVGEGIRSYRTKLERPTTSRP